MKKQNLFLLIAFLLSSCAPAATPIPIAAPSQTPAPARTATYSPTNTSTPAITPTPLPITFIYQDDVPADARGLQEQAAYKAYIYYSQYADLGSLTIYTFSDINQYIDEIFPFIQADVPNHTKPKFIEGWKSMGGTVAQNNIFVNSGYPAWTDYLNLCGKTQIVGHEMFHFLQSKLVGHSLNKLEFDYGADWIIEGSAEVIGFHVIDGMNQCDAEKLAYSYWRTDASVGGALLHELENPDSRQKPKFDSVASWAVDYLIQIAPQGEKSVMEFYSGIGNGESWQEAFESSFGITVQEYYAEFEAIQKGQAIELDKSVCLPQTDSRVKCLGLFDNNGSADFVFEIPIDVSKITPTDQWRSEGECIVTGWGGTPKSPSRFELAISFDSSTHGTCHISIVFSADQQTTVDLVIP